MYNSCLDEKGRAFVHRGPFSSRKSHAHHGSGIEVRGKERSCLARMRKRGGTLGQGVLSLGK